MNESAFSRELRKSLSPHGWFIKMVGGTFVVPGIPDIIGCFNKHFISIECKQIKKMPMRCRSFLWNNLFQSDQIINLQAIKDSGGIALGVIHNAIVSHRQYAIVLNVNQIKQLNSVTLEDYTGLIVQRRLFRIERVNSQWDVMPLLANLDKF